MTIGFLLEKIAVALQPTLDAIRANQEQAPLGLRRSARLPALAALYGELGRPILLITDRADHALAMADELEFWAPQALRLLFPEPTPLFYENASWGEATRRDRLLALTTLAAYHIPGAPLPDTAPVLIAPARALMTRTLPRRDFLRVTHTLKPGQEVQLDDLLRKWITLGYEPVTTVIAPGQFARRGGILDLWPPAEPLPVRIELFGDEIETLRPFDPATQRTTSPAASGLSSPQAGAGRERILVTPAREYLASNESRTAIIPGVETGGQQPGEVSEFHIPLLHPAPASLLDYLPRQALVLVDDQQAVEEMVTDVEEQALKLRQESIREGLLPEDFPIPYLTWAELDDALEHNQAIELGPSSKFFDDSGSSDFETRYSHPDASLPATLVEGSAPLHLADRFQAGQRFGGRLKPLIELLTERYQAGEDMIVVSRQKARLAELWLEQLPTIRRFPSSAAENPLFIEGSLSEGWSFTPQDGKPVHLLTDGEIFGWRKPKPRYRRSERYREAAEDPEAAYTDLRAGDWVVHVDHGIGLFTGLVRRSIDGIEREYLCVEYADEAQLFVPVHQVDRLTRYVGSDNRTPTPSRLGGAEWRNVKSHVKEAVREVAEDLLNLYARRSVIEGFAYNPDSPWQQELETSFPYIETDDQRRVIAEVKRDMENSRPMDRLICGDVGYGKTEVALRAAFKAVSDGRQVAVLVPTTVLAQQHYNTFRQRLAAFPVEVEMLSRFRTPAEQRQITDRLSRNNVDILIGTHRLLSSDVVFKDLGLLIIDEEQRFGVTHKETLKKLRTEVDVLTMTATPIPRTLYMAISGVRDISTINTPPEERLPIVTHVGPYSQKLIRQAVLRELERGGQIFFVHNRVQTIEAMRLNLEKLVPEARIAVAHGQMAEHDLARRMELFSNGEVDILLCTSIIESGLDIPNANTLIVDRADTFGLAQLYQLRGRVGRGAQRAYAYFFRHKRRPPTEEGHQRLETIAENTQLGAGFSIAMRDLEIRGTGDILGTRQSGHIAAVGFHLYTRLLADAVRRLRASEGRGVSSRLSAGEEAALPGQPSQGETTSIEPTSEIMPPALPEYLTGETSLPQANVELPLPSSIPLDYVSDKNSRLGLYRRIAALRLQSEIDALVEELKDRFGPLPESLQNLIYQTRLKLLAERAGLASLSAENDQFVLRYPDGEVPEKLPDLGSMVRIGKTALWIPYKALPDWQAVLVDVLERLKSTGQG